MHILLDSHLPLSMKFWKYIEFQSNSELIDFVHIRMGRHSGKYSAAGLPLCPKSSYRLEIP